MDEKLSRVRKQFVLSVVSFSVLAVFSLGLLLYETNTMRFNPDVSSQDLHSLAQGNEAIVEHLEADSDYRAHFIDVANMIRDDQQENLSNALIIIIVPLLLATAISGYWLAKALLKPVEESYKAQERFIQDAAHELRNPLAAMSATLQSYKMGSSDKKLVGSMKRQTQRLVKISEDLLFLGKHSPDGEPPTINLSDLLEDVLEGMHASGLERGINFRRRIDPEIKLNIFDQDFVRLAKNIISNAIKYSPPKTIVKVALKKENGHILFTVADQGIGIPENELANIGERFYRAKNASQYPGNGLGIAIVRKIASRYGAKLDIASNLGKGTTVKITF